MLSDDQDYLSWLASAALAVLMVVVMVWIRSQIPDDVSSDAMPVQSAAVEDTTAGSGRLSQTRGAIASVYECVSGGARALSDSPCSAGSVLRQIGVPAHRKVGDASVVHHR